MASKVSISSVVTLSVEQVKAIIAEYLKKELNDVDVRYEIGELPDTSQLDTGNPIPIVKGVQVTVQGVLKPHVVKLVDEAVGT